jgi:ABC-2 type transport system ATP-binding protein
MTAIDIRGVSKTFGTHRAVDDVSLEVPEGSIYGFIGPNGSGKTTTIRMIMNIILPDRGEIVVLGKRGTDAARDDVSYLPEERGLYKQMQVRKLLRYYGRLKGRAPRELDPAIAHWLEKLGWPSGATSGSISSRRAWRRRSSSSRPSYRGPNC